MRAKSRVPRQASWSTPLPDLGKEFLKHGGEPPVPCIADSSMGCFPLPLFQRSSQRLVEGLCDPTLSRQTVCLGANNHDQVYVLDKSRTLATKPIANASLDPIADDRIAHPATRADSDTAAIFADSRNHQHYELRARRTAPFARNSIKIS